MLEEKERQKELDKAGIEDIYTKVLCLQKTNIMSLGTGRTEGDI